jgi:hypothetical protein
MYVGMTPLFHNLRHEIEVNDQFTTPSALTPVGTGCAGEPVCKGRRKESPPPPGIELRFSGSRTCTETSILSELTPFLSSHWNPFTLRPLLQMFVCLFRLLLAAEVCTVHRRSSSVMIPDELHTAELHLSGRWLSGPPITRIGLALRVILSSILQNLLALKLPVIGSSTAQCYVF